MATTVYLHCLSRACARWQRPVVTAAEIEQEWRDIAWRLGMSDADIDAGAQVMRLHHEGEAQA